MKYFLQKIMLFFIAILSTSQIGYSQCTVVAGTISTSDPTTICIDGVPDPINVTVMGSSGAESAWIITDAGNNILAIPASGPFDLDGVGAGTCLIWYVRHDGTLAGNVVGNNIIDLTGCFDLSNEITVTRNEAIGGTVAGGPYEFCVGDGIADNIPAGNVTVSGNQGETTQWVVTDNLRNILGLPPSPDAVNFDGVVGGMCYIFSVSYYGTVTGLEIGMSLDDVGGCLSESDNFVTVVRNEPIGGTVAGGPYEFCVGDGIADNIPAGNVTVSGNQGETTQWVVTDDQRNILGLPPSPDVVNFDGAGEGMCYIYSISYYGTLTGLAMGMNLDDVGGCLSESDNFVIVVRNEPNGGTLSTDDETTICVDGIPDPIEITVEDAEGANAQWIITNDTFMILGKPAGPIFDLDGAGPGTCLIWYMRYDGAVLGDTLGGVLDSISGCFDLSDSIVVTRNEPIGGTVAGGPYEFCVGDGVADNIPAGNVTVSGNQGETTQWVVTDNLRNILGLPPSPDAVNFDVAGGGMCYIFSVSYYGTVTGLEVGMSLDDVEGCLSESDNFVTVVRNEPIGGTISTSDPTTICVDGIGDPINVSLTGEAGTNSAWVITDQSMNILGLPSGPPFDLDGAGPGICLIWHLSYEDDLEGLEVGLNTDDFEGCHEFSNNIAVTRDIVDGASVSLLNGETIYSNCPGNVVFDVQNTSENIYFTYYYVITNENNIILEWVDESITSTLDLSAAPAGVCRVWGWNSIGTTTPIMGMHISSLEGQDCEELSDNFISVFRTLPDGGSLELDSGGTEYEGCAGEIDFDLVFSTTTFQNYWFVVTDDNSNILAWFNSDNGGWIDINGAPPGVCRIYGWNEMDQPEPVVGSHISSLNDPLCGDISENFVTITRLDCEDDDCVASGGNIYTSVENIENRVVIANRASGTVSVINSDNDKVISTHEMPNDGEPMYVVYNSLNNTYLVGDYQGYVAAFNANDFSHTGSVEAGNGVFHMWISPDNSQLWINNELDRTISVVNPTTLENIATVEIPSDLYDLGYKPHDVILMPNNAAAFVTFLGTADDDYVVKYSTSTFEETDRVAVGQDPHVALTSNNDKLYVAAQGTSELSVFNRSDLSLVTKVEVPNAHGLGVNTSGTYLYIGNISEGGSNATYTLDLSTNELVGDPVDAPFSAPHNYAVGADDKLYITHSGGANNQVSVYDLTPTPVLNTTVEVGNNPFGLAAFSITMTTDVSICVDGQGDPIDVVRDGTGVGSERTFVITDTEGNILAIPPHNGPFDLDPAGPGTCEIWYMGYEPGLTGLELGGNLSTLEGCYGLSNPITVIREEPDGGTVQLAGGGDVYSQCAGQIVFDVEHFTTAPNLSYWYIITDNNDNILDFHNSANGSTLDLSAAPAGQCRIWGWNYRGLDDPILGDNISTLTDDSCEAISSNYITVNREVPDGGVVMLAGGGDVYSQCAGQIVFDVEHTTTATNLSYWYIITDNNDNILAFHNSANGSTLDLSGAPAGQCRVWGWNYRGLDDPIIGEPLSTLTDDFCEAISDDFITVNREVPDGGVVMLAGGGDEYSQCAGQIVFDVEHTTTATNLSYWYVITDNNDNILAFHNSADGPTLDLSVAPAGECHVWGWNYRGLDDPIVGENISTLTDDFCEAISDNFVTVFREVPDGGIVLLSDGTEEATFEAGDVIFDVQHTTSAPYLSYWYIITDNNDNILAFHNSADGPTLDLSVAPAGECHIWGWNYKGLDDPIIGDNISTLTDDFCEAISENFVTITRTEPTGPVAATISTVDETTICVDGIGDPINVTVDGGQGENSAYVITDVDGNILGLPPMGPFDLDGVGEGVCLIWHLNYTTVEGLEVGMNSSDLTGEYAFSNFIEVIRQAANGGQVSLSDGSEEATFIAGNVVFDVQHETTATALSYWYIITNNDDNILAYHNSADGPTLDLGVAPVGECHVWGWSYKGEPNPVIGENISTLSDGACEAISDNFIRIIRTEGISAATISTTDETIICVDGVGDPINVTVAGGQGNNSAYVITDVDGNILGLPPMGPFDLDGAGEGVCLIWHLYYETIDGLDVGLNANDLTGEYAFSNAITVTRQAANGGVVALTNGLDTATYCVGEVVFDAMHETTATALGYWYVITDNNDNILVVHNTQDGPTLDLSAAPAGECHVWGWSSNGETTPVVGESISSLEAACGSISENFISIFRAEGIVGGVVSTESSVVACPNDGEDDFVNIITTGSGDQYAYILTDENDNILGTPTLAPVINFENMESGIARIYGLGYAGMVEIGNKITDINGTCAALSSNFIEVVIQETAECAVTSTEELDGADVNIYPNPAVNYVTLEYNDLAKNASVNVFDVQGKMVLSETLSDGSGISKLDVQNLLGGIYMVLVTSDKNSITKRVLITK